MEDLDSDRFARRIAFVKRTKNLHENYKAVFDTPQGQVVIKHLMKIGHVFEPSFTSGDPNITAFKEGQRHIVLSILRFLAKDQKELERIIQDAVENYHEERII